MAIVIARRFRGPEASGNGGYSAGLIARELGGHEVDVTLRLPPDPVAWGDAVAAESVDLDSPFPQCFVCGHARGEDGLHLHAGPVEGRDVLAAHWTVSDDTVGEEFAWAALDCPGAYATGVP